MKNLAAFTVYILAQVLLAFKMAAGVPEVDQKLGLERKKWKNRVKLVIFTVA